MQINNSRSSNPNFTAIRVVTATPQEVRNFSNNFRSFSNRNLMLKENTKSSLVVITGMDKLKYLCKTIKDTLSGISYSSEAKRMYMSAEAPYGEAVSICEKMFNSKKSASFNEFLQNNNAKHISMDELVQEVKTNKI